MLRVYLFRNIWLRSLRNVAGLVLLFAATTLPADAPATSQPDQIIAFLNQTLVWYRLLNTQQQLVIEPSDAVYLSDNRQIADQVVRLAFEFARAEAQQIAGQNPVGATDAQNQPNQSLNQNLINLLEKSKRQIGDEEKELDSFKQQLSNATGKKRTVVQSEIAESEDELELLKARRDTLQNMLQFSSGTTALTGPKGLQAQIEQLARTMPASLTDSSKSSSLEPSSASTPPPAPTAAERKNPPSGIFGLVAEVFEYRHKVRLLDTSLSLTDELSDSSKALRSPLVARIKEFTKRSDDLANQPSSQDPAVLAQQQTELKGLTAQYKQLSAAILPLSKQNLLLGLYKRNVANWQSAVQAQYSQLLKDLLSRLAILGGILLLIFVASLLWRRATFRYVHDGRRRHQFLILRRIIVVPLVLIIIVVAFANGLGSVTLFAGLSTAGLAVALQNLIQSVVGYFVLIGKYGVRVGDRIQVGAVTGDVIDIGMVRLHLVEVTSGAGSRPTGRVVAFSNSVVFQPDSGFFKQIPGTNFAWHEVSLTLSPDSDYRQVEKRMLSAVNQVFDDYKEKMESQRLSMERTIHGLSVEPLHPESRLNLTPTGTQVVVRYPVEVEASAEIDNRIAREVLDATGREPHVQVSEAPETTVEEGAEAAKGSN